MQQRRTTMRLPDLPNEILGHIFDFLDQQPPSERNFNDQPRKDLTKSTSIPLKQTSLVSADLRRLTLPKLFRHARLDPYHLTAFLQFVQSANLSTHVVTLVAQLQGPCSHLHPKWWARLLNEVPTRVLVVLCAPSIFAELTGISIDGRDDWAFDMEFHCLRVEQSHEATRQHISYNSQPNLLSARPWTSLRCNEGSSLKAYRTYEFFLRNSPSLLASLHTDKSMAAGDMFARLVDFSYVAIFPFYNHVDSVLKCVRKMTRLQKLFIKLCPEPEASTILQDELDQAQIDVNDPWQELETAHGLVAFTVVFLTVNGALEQLQVDDLRMEGIRSTLEDIYQRQLTGTWQYDGVTTWNTTQLRQSGDRLSSQ